MQTFQRFWKLENNVKNSNVTLMMKDIICKKMTSMSDSYVKVFYLDYGFADEDVPTLPKTLDEWMTRTKDPS